MLPPSVMDNPGNSQKSLSKDKEIDTRRFSPTIKNEAKYYNAIVRFLPQADLSAPLYVEKFSHGFQENGQWFIEECPTTLGAGNKCPVCESNRNAYATKDQALINRAKDRKRKKVYIANVLVIKDKQNPQNEGKVMYWQFPKTIFDLINLKWNPESEYDEKSQPFCPVTGFALNLVMKYDEKTKYPTYLGSQFMSSKSLGSDDVIEAIMNQTHDLGEFVSPTKIKSYEALTERFVKVTNPNIVSAMGNLVVASTTNIVGTSAAPTVAIPVLAKEEDDETDAWLEEKD